MAEWIFNGRGNATMLFDVDCIRNRNGQVVAWLGTTSIYDLKGSHIGWCEKGVFYDSNNNVLGFIRSRTGHLPSIPGLSGVPGMPGLAGRPGRPGFSGVPGRPGYGGWSNTLIENYF